MKNTLRSQLGAFVLSNSQRIMSNYIREINGIYNNNIYYCETDSLYIEKKYWDVLDEGNLVGSNLCQGKNDYKSGGISYGSLIAPKIIYCLIIEKHGFIQQHMTFEDFKESKRLLHRSQCFKISEGEKQTVMLPRSW